MKLKIIEKTYPAASITAPLKTEWLDLGNNGCDTLAYVLTVTAASTPNTANIQIEGSLDKTNFVTVGSAVNVTANGVLAVSVDRPVLRYYRLAYAITSGSYTSNLSVLAKGDKE